MTDKQPEALRLANALEKEIVRTVHLDVLHQDALNELRRLHKIERAFDLWIEKTEWVQESCSAEELGMHRADVMKQRIDRLHEVNAELLEALKILVDYYASPIARDAIRKATGEQQ
jgi:hypothetical protein